MSKDDAVVSQDTEDMVCCEGGLDWGMRGFACAWVSKLGILA